MERSKELDSRILLGRYRIVQLLAEGGMGKVYLARVEGAEGFTRPVVVKVMKAEMRQSEEANRLFRREAEILSKMQHPTITNIIDYGVEEGAHIMVLEYVHGYALARWIDFHYSRDKHLPVELCIFIIRRILDALHYAHHFEIDDGNEIEIVHRDVAPDNVILDRKGYLYLLDFGIARVRAPERRSGSSHSGVFRGKLGYAAPETLEGEPATAKADQYSAAAMLLELLTLEAPFYSESVGETVQKMMHETPPSPKRVRSDVPPELEAAVMKALSKRPHDRFETVGDFSRAIRACQSADDEDLITDLRALVRQDFEELPAELSIEPLQVREEALTRIFPSLTPEQLDDRSTFSAEQFQEATEKQARGIKRLLWALLSVAAVLALGVGAVVGLLSDRSNEQVVVVGTEDRKVTAPNAPALATSPAAEDVPAAESNVGTAQTLSEAIQRKGAEFEECFVSHLDDAEKSPEATVHFTLSPGKTQATVQVEPAPVRKSPLGNCLSRAARAVKFPVHGKSISFSVPVRARVAPLK